MTQSTKKSLDLVDVALTDQGRKLRRLSTKSYFLRHASLGNIVLESALQTREIQYGENHQVSRSL